MNTLLATLMQLEAFREWENLNKPLQRTYTFRSKQYGDLCGMAFIMGRAVIFDIYEGHGQQDGLILSFLRHRSAVL